MGIEAIVAIITQQATIWGPAIAAIAGIVVAVVTGNKKVNKELGEIRTVAQDIQEQKAIKDLTAELKGLRNDNRELKKQNREIIEQLSRIRKRKGDKE